MKRIVPLLLLSLALSTACGEKPADPAGAAPPPPAGLAGAPGTPTTGGEAGGLLALPDATVVVEVNGVALDRAAFGRSLQNQLMAAGRPLEALPAELQAMVQHRAYMQLVEREILRQKGVELNLVPPKDVVEKSIAELTARIPAGKTLADFLVEMKTDEATFKKEMEANLVIAAVLEAGEATVPKVTDADAQSIFNARKEFYAENRSAKARQILIRALPVAPPEEIQKALARAQEIRTSVVGKKEDQFAAIAREKSEDPRTRESGGDMGSFTARDVLPELADVAFKLKKGEVSEPIRSERGFHILFGLGVTNGKPRTFADVKEQIVTSEQLKRRNEVMEKYVRGIIEAAKVVEHHTPPQPPRQGFAPPGGPMGGPGGPGPGGPPGGPGGMPAHGPGGAGGAMGAHALPPGTDVSQLPVPSKDNVLPGVRSPHSAAPTGELRLGEPGGSPDLRLKKPE